MWQFDVIISFESFDGHVYQTANSEESATILSTGLINGNWSSMYPEVTIKNERYRTLEKGFRTRIDQPTKENPTTFRITFMIEVVKG